MLGLVKPKERMQRKALRERQSYYSANEQGGPWRERLPLAIEERQYGELPATFLE
jgi:hypothetical protein